MRGKDAKGRTGLYWVWESEANQDRSLAVLKHRRENPIHDRESSVSDEDEGTIYLTPQSSESSDMDVDDGADLGDAVINEGNPCDPVIYGGNPGDPVIYDPENDLENVPFDYVKVWDGAQEFADEVEDLSLIHI